MEIACDIIKQKLDKSNKSFELSIAQNFKDLNLKNICSLNDFFNLSKKEKYIDATRNLLKLYFQNVDMVMISAIQMAYCISLFSDKIFDSYKNKFEQKLIYSANKVMITIERIIGITEENMEPSNFYNIIDNYLSLYKIWKSQDSIDSLNKVYCEYEKELRIIKIKKKRKMNICLDKLNGYINKMFEINPKYATRILLHNYPNFIMGNHEEYFWESVKKAYEEFPEIIFITLVSELKILLIPFLKNPSERKEIYYNIDTEDLIKQIGISGISKKMISDVLDIFCKFIFEDINVDNYKKDIDLFSVLYGELLKKYI